MFSLFNTDTRRHICIFLCITVILCSSCAPKSSPDSIVLALAENETDSVGGTLYSLSAEECEREYLSDEMLLSLYGFDRNISPLIDGAVYLSDFCHPCEFAVFICEDSYVAEDIALHFHNRLKLLSESASVSAAFCGMTVEEYKEYISSAEVVTYGRYVALIISTDTKSAKRIFFSKI